LKKAQAKACGYQDYLFNLYKKLKAKSYFP